MSRAWHLQKSPAHRNLMAPLNRSRQSETPNANEGPVRALVVSPALPPPSVATGEVPTRCGQRTYGRLMYSNERDASLRAVRRPLASFSATDQSGPEMHLNAPLRELPLAVGRATEMPCAFADILCRQGDAT